MYYKIGTLAKRFGITTQAIRFYEKQGLLVSQFEEDSTTRRYHTRNLKWLSSIRRYHEMGFGMKEIQRLFLCEAPPEITQRMEEHEAELLAQIAEREKQLRAVRRQKADIERIGELLGVCRVEASPQLLLLIDQDGQRLDESQDVREVWENWIQQLAFVHSAVLVAPEAIASGDEFAGRRSGYCVEQEIARQLELKISKRVRAFECETCIHTIAMRARENRCNELSYAADFARQNGLTLAGDAVGRCLCKVGESSCRDEQVIPKALYYEYWIPVKIEKKSTIAP